MVRKGKPTKDRIPRVVLHPAVHRAFFEKRLDTGEPVQRQVDEVLRKHLKAQGVTIEETEPAAAT